MAISELIKPGDKVDLQLIQQLESAQKSGTTALIFKSQVLDRKSNGNFIISMPIQNGKVILLSLGARYELTFYSKNGMYRCIGQVAERYKKENIFMLEVEPKTQLERYQRREYYRYQCNMDLTFYKLDEEQKKMESEVEILNNLTEGNSQDNRLQGIIVDLSGGGMKFRSEVELQLNDMIMIMLRLTSGKMDNQFWILGKVIECKDVRKEKLPFYEIRAEFQIKDNKIREEIIRFIFEEERKIRKKENG